MVNCITAVVGHECQECGQPAEASGQLVGRGDRCGARTCPRCARRRAAAYRDLGERLQRRATPILPGWSWKMITLTAKYDPGDEDDLTIAALRDRYTGHRASFRMIFKRLQALAGEDWRSVGGLCAVELAGTGNVHLHAVVLSPYIDKDDMALLAVTAWGGAGYVDIREADAGAIGEVCKYPLKTPGGAGEAWIGGAKCFDRKGNPGLVHPRLAARWEIALLHRRVLDRYGSFRGVPLNEKAVTEAPSPLPACLCGALAWCKVIESPEKWIGRFRGTGQSALATPRAIRERDKGNEHGREARTRSFPADIGAGAGGDWCARETRTGAS